MSDVFISHDTADKDLVLQLAQLLEDAGISTWYYERDAVPGVPHTSQTGNAIAAAKATLLVVSFDSIRSYEVNTEVNWTYSEHKSFVPVLVGITWAQFAHEKKAWQQLIGLSAGIEATPDNLPMVVSKIAKGLRQLELAAADRPAPASAPADFPPLKTRADAPASAPRHNLPVQLTNFIGRTQPIAEVKRLLQGSRLLTLTGPGGTGKTRLALQVAADVLDNVADGAWLVELAPVADPALVPQAVAQALALRAEHSAPGEPAPGDPAPADQSGRNALSLVVNHLRHKTLLLILDNCEHLIGACAELAEQLLRAAPGLRIVATSREALGAVGEHTYLVPALAVPEPGQLPGPEALAQTEAVRLFVERAAAVRSDFALTAENAPAVALICRRLEGIPLAIELAAARAGALTADQIAAQLAEHTRLHLLTGGSRTAPPRQQTLRGALDWSYALLTDAERSLLRRLSVFVGGWTLEAAEQVMSAPDVLDLLTQVVGKCLVLSTQAPRQEARFSMLETIREYLHEKLVEAGELDSVYGRHLAYYLALAEAAEIELRGRHQVKWVQRLDRESDNLRAALGWAVKTDDAETAQRMAGALSYFWVIRGYVAEGRRWLAAALQLRMSPDALGPCAWHARALVGAGHLDRDTMWLNTWQVRVGGPGWLDKDKHLGASRYWLEQAIEIYRELGDNAGIAYALYFSGSYSLVTQKDYPSALGLYQQALDLALAVEDGWIVGICLHRMGHAAEEMGDIPRAREFYQRSVEILRKEGDSWQLIWPQDHLFQYSWADGDAVSARAVLEENLAAHRELGWEQAIVRTLHHLYWNSAWQGHYAQAAQEALSILHTTSDPIEIAAARTLMGRLEYLQGRLPEARDHFEVALKTFQELNAQRLLGWLLPLLGCVAYRAGDLDQAQVLIERGRALLDRGQSWERAVALLSLGDLARAQGKPAAAAEQYTLSLEIAVKYSNQPLVVQLLEGFAKLAGAVAQPARAARMLGAAAALRLRLGTPIPPVEQADYDDAVALARDELDPAAFGAAWADGRTLGWEQAAAYALWDDAS